MSTLNKTLASVIRSLDAQPTGDVWATAKAVVTPANIEQAAEVLATNTAFAKAVKAQAKAQAKAKASRPAPEPGTLKHAIANYEPKAKTEVFVKADGTKVPCTPAQKRAWEQGRTRFESRSTKAEGGTKVTQEAKVEAIAKALVEKPELLEALAGLLK